MIVITLVLWRTSSIMPREGTVSFIQLVYVVIHSSARSPRRIVKRRIDWPLSANTFAISALYGAPTAMGMMQTLRALLESTTRSGTSVFLNFSQHEAANSSSTVYGLVRRGYAFAKVGGPVALGVAPLCPIRAEARRAIVKSVTTTWTFLFSRRSQTGTPLFLYQCARPIKQLGWIFW
jgi:hypothetical protein